MKRILMLISLFIMGSFLAARGEEIVKELSLHYDLKDFRVDEKGDLIAIRVIPVLEMLPVIDYNLPELPKFVYIVLDGDFYDEYEYEWEVKHSEKQVFRENVDINTMYPDKPGRGEMFGWVKFDRFDEYNQDQVNVDCFQGAVRVWATPFEYDTTTRTVYFTQNIDVTVKINQKNKTPSPKGTIIHLRDKVQNQGNDDINVIPKDDPGLELIEDYINPTGVDYLIITSNELKEAYLPLLEWKKQKGLKTKILTVEEIEAQYEGNSRQEKVKNCIVYHRNVDGLVYVLLGGNNTTIPSRGCSGSVNLDGEKLTDNTIPADLYHACTLGDTHWDTNGNGLYGEPEDNCNLSSQVAVTRVPLGTATEIEAFVAKVLEYEKFGKVADDFNILLTGAKMDWTENGHSDAEIIGNLMAESGIIPFWDGDILRKFDTSDNGYTIDAKFIANEISKGHAFMDVQSHGERANWVFPYSRKFGKKTNTSKINNIGSTIITTNACDVNAFDKSPSSSDPCLSQYLIGDLENGVVAFYGCSRKGIGSINKDQLGGSQLFESSFYSYLFKNTEENKSFGRIIGLSKRNFINRSSGTNFFRWLQFGMNPIGDPEMPIYVTKPKKI